MTPAARPPAKAAASRPAKAARAHHAPDAAAPYGTPLTRAVAAITAALGSFPAIGFAAALILTWVVGLFLVRGGFLNQNYQLVINTLTTIITFLMVFVIQNTQNRDGRALQTKLDAQTEALAAIAVALGIDDEDLPTLKRLIGVEDAPDADIRDLQQAVRAKNEAGGRGDTRAVSAASSLRD
jgi:low affinity Fe/Cu permease